MTRTAIALVALALAACTEGGTTRPPFDGDAGPTPPCQEPWPANLRYVTGHTSTGAAVWYEEAVVDRPRYATASPTFTTATETNGTPLCIMAWESRRPIGLDSTEVARISVSSPAFSQSSWNGRVTIEPRTASGSTFSGTAQVSDW
jgi:hypothetical protein